MIKTYMKISTDKQTITKYFKRFNFVSHSGVCEMGSRILDLLFIYALQLLWGVSSIVLGLSCSQSIQIGESIILVSFYLLPQEKLERDAVSWH